MEYQEPIEMALRHFANTKRSPRIRLITLTTRQPVESAHKSLVQCQIAVSEMSDRNLSSQRGGRQNCM